MTDDLNRLRAVTDEERYELGHPSPLGELVRQHQEKRSPARGVEACVCGRSVVGVPGWYLAHFASEMRAMVEANVAARTAMPAIREAIAQEIEAIPTMEPVTDKHGAPIDGLTTMIPPSRVKEEAARIARGGAA